MKKSSSAPNLARAHSGKPTQPAASGLAACSRRGVGSSSSLSTIAQDDTPSLQSRNSFGGTTRQHGRSTASSVRRPSGSVVAQAALTPDAPAPPPYYQYNALEQVAADSGKWFLEGASHGIASTDCFSLFGYPSEAPNLRDEETIGSIPVQESAQERSRKIAEAACLLTPASGQERDAGTQVRSSVSRAEIVNQMQTQMRFAEEIRRVAEAETLHAARQGEAFQGCAMRAANSSPRYRRERRTRGDDPFCTRPGAPSRGTPVSPRTAQVLAESYGVDAAQQNTRTVDEDDWASEESSLVATAIDLPHPHTATDILQPLEADSPFARVASPSTDSYIGPDGSAAAVPADPTAPSEFGDGSGSVTPLRSLIPNVHGETSIGSRSASAPVVGAAEGSLKPEGPPKAADVDEGLDDAGTRKEDAPVWVPSRAASPPGDGSPLREDGGRPPSPPKHPDADQEKRMREDNKENGGGWGMSNAVPFVRRPRSLKGSTAGAATSEGSPSNIHHLRS